tara:strand:+ start:61 stop:354 length:294 start_codon:yes stop_codon:yes gene_type:complete
MTLSKKDAEEELKKIEDPELQIDIFTLGLIYDIDIKEDNHCIVTMTLTSPACPYGPVIMDAVKHGLDKKGFKDTKVELSFDPPWEPNDDIKMMLGMS